MGKEGSMRRREVWGRRGRMGKEGSVGKEGEHGEGGEHEEGGEHGFTKWPEAEQQQVWQTFCLRFFAIMAGHK